MLAVSHTYTYLQCKDVGLAAEIAVPHCVWKIILNVSRVTVAIIIMMIFRFSCVRFAKIGRRRVIKRHYYHSYSILSF